MGNQKLTVEARIALFEHYSAHWRFSTASFLRYTLMSNSSRIIARQYLREMILRQCSYGSYYTLEKEKSKTLWLSYSTILSVLDLLKPQGFTVCIESHFDLERLNSLLVHLNGANKLWVEIDDPAIVPFVQSFADRLVELKCFVRPLMVPGLPPLSLDKFKLKYVANLEPLNLGYILRHEIKELDLTDITWLRGDIQFGEIRNNTITCLRLKVIDINDLAHRLLPFINKFRGNVPSLHTVDLIVEMGIISLSGSHLTACIISTYDKIMSFKDKMQGTLPKLSIRFSGRTEIEYNFPDGVETWIATLSKHESFKNAEFERFDPCRNNKFAEVKLLYEDTGSMIFMLSFEVPFQTLYSRRRIHKRPYF